MIWKQDLGNYISKNTWKLYLPYQYSNPSPLKSQECTEQHSKQTLHNVPFHDILFFISWLSRNSPYNWVGIHPLYRATESEGLIAAHLSKMHPPISQVDFWGKHPLRWWIYFHSIIWNHQLPKTWGCSPTKWPFIDYKCGFQLLIY